VDRVIVDVRGPATRRNDADFSDGVQRGDAVTANGVFYARDDVLHALTPL
jgi:hypothetical protein